MKSIRTKAYDELFAKLPSNVQKQARKANRLFDENPSYPSFRFKPIDKEESRYSLRVNEKYRIVGKKVGDTIYWYFIGKHSDYDHLL